MFRFDHRPACVAAPFLFCALLMTRAHAQDSNNLVTAPERSMSVRKMDLKDVREPDPRFVIGYHQAGASSAESHGHFFTNFYTERHLWNPAWRLWGNVTIASYPQQISTPVGEFITGLADQFAKLPVNQVAQSAEFQTGVERLIRAWDVDKAQGSPGADGHRIRTFGIIAGLGATGPMNPVESLKVFSMPAPGTAQYPDLVRQYPQLTNAKYVGFTTPDRDRFFRQYSVGVRVSTYINSASGHMAPPATYELTVGQDEAVTGGQFKGIVTRFSCFYPLALPTGDQTNSDKNRFLYLFGMASLRAGRGDNRQPFILEPAGVDIKGYSPGVSLIAAASNRDTYRIGIGVDFVNLFKSIKPPGKSTPDASTTPK
jgi:hypothetical protein